MASIRTRVLNPFRRRCNVKIFKGENDHDKFFAHLDTLFANQEIRKATGKWITQALNTERFTNQYFGGYELMVVDFQIPEEEGKIPGMALVVYLKDDDGKPHSEMLFLRFARTNEDAPMRIVKIYPQEQTTSWAAINTTKNEVA